MKFLAASRELIPAADRKKQDAYSSVPEKTEQTLFPTGVKAEYDAFEVLEEKPRLTNLTGEDNSL